MKVLLNKELETLGEFYHRGDMTIGEYRLQRRKLLEQLAMESRTEFCPVKGSNRKLYKRIFVGTTMMLILLGITVLIVKLLA